MTTIRLGNFSMSLAVKDLTASLTFYGKLGFRVIDGDRKSWAILQNDASTIGLFMGVIPANTLTYNPGWDRTGATLPDFDDVRDIQRRLEAEGVTLTKRVDPASTGPGFITLLDPDGNAILIDQHATAPSK